MKIHNPPFTFKDADGEAAWKADYDVNINNPYGDAILRFASEWATQMEDAANMLSAVNGVDMTQLPAQISFMIKHADVKMRQADDEGITGFMYGCAVSCLSRAWIYGEALRRWHNKDTQLETEGDATNENGGVLNPAIINIG